MGIAFRLVDDCGEGAIRLLDSYWLVDGDGNCRRLSSHGKCRARSEVRRHVCQGSKHYLCACDRRYRSLQKSSFLGEGFSFAKIVVAARACAGQRSGQRMILINDGLGPKTPAVALIGRGPRPSYRGLVRKIMTGIGPVAMRCPRVRDRKRAQELGARQSR